MAFLSKDKERGGFGMGVGATKMSLCLQSWPDLTRFPLSDSTLAKSAFMFKFLSSTFCFALAR